MKRAAETEPENFTAFLVSFLEAIVQQTNLEKFKKSEFVYDLTEFIEQFEQNIEGYRANWGSQPNLKPENTQDEVMQ